MCWHADRGEIETVLICDAFAHVCNLFCNQFFFQILAVYVRLFGPARYKVNNIVNFSGKYIHVDDERPPHYRKLCEKFVENFERTIMVVMGLLLISYNLLGFWPLCLIVFRRERITLLNIEFPFMDNYSDIGFMINLSISSFMSVFALFSNTAIEFGACLVLNAINSIPDVFRFEIQELETELNSNGMSSVTKLRLRNILMMIQDLDE